MTLGFQRGTTAPRPRWAAAGVLAVAALIAATPAAATTQQSTTTTTQQSTTTSARSSTNTAATDSGFCNAAHTIACTFNGFTEQNGTMRFALGALRDNQAISIDPTSIRVSGTINRRLAGISSGTPISGSDQTVTRKVMLLLDVSRSMWDKDQNNRFDAQIAAASTFIELAKQNPSSLQVGIVTFGNRATTRLQPQTDLNKVQSAINALGRFTKDDLDNSTDLFGAVIEGVRSMGPDGSRSLLMITDGLFSPPKPVTEQAKRVIEAQVHTALAGRSPNKKVAPNPVRFKGVLVGDERDADIKSIGTNITKLEATSSLAEKLKDFVAAGAKEQEKTLTVSAPILPSWSGQAVRLTIQATASGVPFSYPFDYVFKPAAAATTAAAAPSPSTPSRITTIPSWVVILSLAAVFAALAVLLAITTGGIATANDGGSAVIRRLEVYTVSGGSPSRVAVTEQTTRLGDSALTRSAVSLMTRLARKVQVDRALDSQLESAGLPLRTAEWMLLHIGIAVAMALGLLLISGGKVAALVLGLLIGLAGPWLFLSLARSRRESRFLSQLPDTLQLLAGSLAAGYSLPQAMDSVVRESEPPISLEFNRALIEARLGVPPEDALDGIAKRTDSTDFSWIVMAIRIQRDVGGNLAELLSSVAGTLRERERLRRQVNALSAEGRLSGLILGALPLVFGLYLMLTKPDYIAPLFDTKIGLFLLGLGIVLLVVGGFWMAKVIKVKV